MYVKVCMYRVYVCIRGLACKRLHVGIRGKVGIGVYKRVCRFG